MPPPSFVLCSLVVLTMVSRGPGAAGQASGPTVRVAQGALQGKEVTSAATGKTFYSFQGVPYAQPPLGRLRFRDAQPPKPWSGVRDATNVGSECLQLSSGSSTAEGSEDCLFVNVYTPRLPKLGSKALPVMFWVHGGGFNEGSGSDKEFGPDFLVAEDVVLVTINYRLNCFGFLFLRDAAPGNVGLKDQLAALRWVNQNIAAFNGNPREVTIVGQSAGAISVHLFTLSPLTKGLFKRAIAESGSALSPWGHMYQPYETSKRLADAVGCTGKSDEDVIECLRGVDSEKLVKAARFQAPPARNKGRFLLFPFIPTTEERKVAGVETFLTAHPMNLIKQGCQQDVPYLTGFNSDEWMIVAQPNEARFNSEDKLKSFDSNWTRYIFPETRIPDDSTKVSQAMEDLRKYYLNGKPLTYDNLKNYEQMLTDLIAANGIIFSAEESVKSKKAPTYMYYFTVDEKLNLLKQTFNLTSPGAAHVDEIGYLFNVKSLPKVSSDDPAALARQRMVRMWTNFAKQGNPIPGGDSLLDAKWKPFDDGTRNFLEIGSVLKAGTGFYKETEEFYSDFYKKYGEQGESSGICSPCSGPLRTVLTLPYCVTSKLVQSINI